MNVLVACEESQAVCKAFRERGHRAFSADIQPCSGGHPEWHIQGDVMDVIDPPIWIVPFDWNERREMFGTFQTSDGRRHNLPPRWDLIIAHPPCTYLSNAGACRLYPQKGHIDMERYQKGLKAKEFFMEIMNADCDHICIENPIPSKVFNLPTYTQIIQPYQFGHPWSKKTCLWLKGLPNLLPTDVLNDYKPYVSCGTSSNKGNPDKAGFSRAGGAAKIRSKTFPGIAAAMAEQWGGLEEK